MVLENICCDSPIGGWGLSDVDLLFILQSKIAKFPGRIYHSAETGDIEYFDCGQKDSGISRSVLSPTATRFPL